MVKKRAIIQAIRYFLPVVFLVGMLVLFSSWRSIRTMLFHAYKRPAQTSYNQPGQTYNQPIDQGFSQQGGTTPRPYSSPKTQSTRNDLNHPALASPILSWSQSGIVTRKADWPEEKAERIGRIYTFPHDPSQQPPIDPEKVTTPLGLVENDEKTFLPLSDSPLDQAIPDQVKTVPVLEVPTRIKVAHSHFDQAKDYQRTIHRSIEKHKHYPPLAVKRGWEGNVGIRFLIHRDGHIEKVSVTRSSKIALLDEAAISAVKDGNPFPPFPENISDPSVWIEIVLNFALQGAGFM